MKFLNISYKILFYLVLFVLILALSVINNCLDYDLWARLINGEHVFYNYFPMFLDVVSYSNTHIWYDPEWLSSAFIYFIQMKYGIIGLTILKSFLVFIMFLFISIAIKEKLQKEKSNLNIGFYLSLILICVQSAMLIFTVRCQLITFILMALWLLILEKIRKGNNLYLFFLPLIMLFWLNSHGGSISGVGILFLYGIGEFLNKKPYKKYFVALFFVCLMFFINPWGINFIQFMIHSAFLDRSWISEWQSPFSSSVTSQLAYKLFILFSFLVYIFKIFVEKIKYDKLDKTKLIILFVVLILSAKYVKHIGLFVVIYSIFMYEDFYFIYNFFMEKLRNYLQIEENVIPKLKKIKLITTYFFVIAFSLFILATKPIKSSCNISTLLYYPIYPLEFLKLNNISGNIFTGFYNNSFIAYKYYPSLKIFMDGRQEQVYDSNTFDESMNFIMSSSDNSYNFIKKYKTDIFLVEEGWLVNNFLKKNKDLKKIYSDNKYVLYVRSNLQKDKYLYPNPDVTTITKDIFKKEYDFANRKL